MIKLKDGRDLENTKSRAVKIMGKLLVSFDEENDNDSQSISLNYDDVQLVYNSLLEYDFVLFYLRSKGMFK